MLYFSSYAELEEVRYAINGGYCDEDLFLKWDEVDDEKTLICRLLEDLDSEVRMLKEKKKQRWDNFDNISRKKGNAKW